MTRSTADGRLRVLLVTNMYPSRRAPFYGTFVHDEVTALREAGLDVDVLAVDGRRSRWAYAAAFPRLWRRLARRRYDLIHAHHAFAGVIARAQIGLPVVMTQHGLIGVGRSPLQRRLSALLRLVLDERVYVGERVRAALGDDRSGWVIPCGVDLSRFRPRDRKQARAMFGVPHDRRLVLFAADPSRPGALPGRRRAVDLARIDLSDLELVVSYDRPHADMPALMAACDVLLVASACEGSPIVVKEALASRLPVVSTAVVTPDLVGGLAGCALADATPESLASRSSRCSGRRGEPLQKVVLASRTYAGRRVG